MYKPIDETTLNELAGSVEFFLTMDQRWSHASSYTFIPHMIKYKLKNVAASVHLFDLYLTQTGSKLSLERVRINKKLDTAVAKPTIYGFWEIVMRRYIPQWTRNYDCSKVVVETGLSNTPELFMELGYNILKVNTAVADDQQAYKGEKQCLSQ